MGVGDRRCPSPSRNRWAAKICRGGRSPRRDNAQFGMRLPLGHSHPSNPPCSRCLLATHVHHPSHHVSLRGDPWVPAHHLTLFWQSPWPSQKAQENKADAADAQCWCSSKFCGTGSEMFFPRATEKFFISGFYYKVTGSCMFITRCWI